jgi:hypothetical protein
MASDSGDSRVVHGGDMNTFVALIPIIFYLAIFIYIFKLATRAVVALEKIADRLGGEEDATDEPPSNK